tara:strand:- start:5370 stop:10733 length:5364 start_codon:yes stop_codon:yes gene_type:complete
MSNREYFISSEFFELLKSAEETDESEKTSEEGPSNESQPSEEVVEEDKVTPSEILDEKTLDAITPEFAKLIARSRPSMFFEQSLDKKYPDLVLSAMNNLWLDEDGYFEFFRLRRNGVRLYKDYPNSVKSFILHKLPVGYYFKWKLNEEFPQYLEVLKKRWKGFPTSPNGVEGFFRDQLYFFEPEETISKIEDILYNKGGYTDHANWVHRILTFIPKRFLIKNIDFFKEAFDKLFDSPDRAYQTAVIASYFKKELYKEMPELLDKFASSLSAYSYFSHYSVHKIEDKDTVKSRVKKFIEEGYFSSLPREYQTLETYELVAKRELDRLSEYINRLEAEGNYLIKDEDGYREEVDLSYAVAEVSLYKVLEYIRLLNGENFSALDESYIDKSEALPGVSFKETFEYIIKNLGSELFKHGDLTNFLFTHKYNILYKSAFDKSLSELVSGFEEKNTSYGYVPEKYFEKSFLSNKIKKSLYSNHKKAFMEFFEMLLEKSPSAWVKSSANEYPQLDSIVLERLKRNTKSYFHRGRNKHYEREDNNIILNIIKDNPEFYKKHYDSLKSIVKDLYLNNDKIKTYFVLYREYFPDLDKNLIVNDEFKDGITPVQALVNNDASLYFKKENIYSDEFRKDSFVFNRSNNLNLIDEYPEYTESALLFMIEKETAKSSTSIKGVIHFVLNSKQFSNKTRKEILESYAFENLLKSNLRNSTLKDYIKKYPSTFGGEIKEFLEKDFEIIFNNNNESHDLKRKMHSSEFIKLFFNSGWESKPYRDLFPEISRKTFTAMLSASKNDLSILDSITGMDSYPDIFNSFIKDEDIYDIIKKLEHTPGAGNYNRKSAFSRQLAYDSSNEVLLPKIKDVLESDSYNFLKTIFKSNLIAEFIFNNVAKEKLLMELFYNSLREYYPNLAFAILMAKLSGYGDIRINSKSHGKSHRFFPDFDNQINKLLSIPIERVNFDDIEAIFSSSPFDGFYRILKEIGRDPAFANLESFSNLKKYFNQYLFSKKPLIVIRRSKDDLEVGAVVKGVVESFDRRTLVYDDMERLINNAKEVLKFLYENHRSPKPIFPEKEKLTTSLIRLSEDPLLYFEMKKRIIARNESSGAEPGYHTEQFDLEHFEGIDDFKKESLLKIASDKELFETFFFREYFKYISKEEETALFKTLALTDTPNLMRILASLRPPSDRLFLDIIEENLELNIYLGKILLDKNMIPEFLRFNFYKEIIENNIFSLDDIINLVFNYISSQGGSYSGIDSTTHDNFLRYLNSYNPDRVGDFLKKIYGYRPYSLSFIKKHSEKTSQEIAREVVVNAEKYIQENERVKIAEAFTYEKVFNYPEAEASLLHLIENNMAVIGANGLFVGPNSAVQSTSSTSFVMTLVDFIVKNYIFYKKYKDSIPNIKLGFDFFRKLKERSVAIELLPELQNENFLAESSTDNKGAQIILEELSGIKDLKINRSIYQTEQRPSEWLSSTRYTLSQINRKPNESMYEVNKKLIHAGDGVEHTNVGASGFTSAWGLFSIQTENRDSESFFVIEQYQSDYPVVLNNTFNAEKEGNSGLKEKYPRHYKDIVAHFNIISAAYPYLILTKAIQTAIIAGFSHIYILKDAARLADIKNLDKAKKLYEDIPLEVASGTRVIRDNLCWEIEATQESISRLMSRAREVTGKDSKYDFSLSPAQNAELRVRDRERRRKAPWVASAEKIQKLKEINLFVKDRFPEINVPSFTNPTDAIRFLNEEIKKKMTKSQFKREFSSVVRDLAILKRSWERTIGMIKFARLSKEKTRFKSLELIYLEACFSGFLK